MKKIIYYEPINDKEINVSEGEYKFIKLENNNLYDNKLTKICNTLNEVKNLNDYKGMLLVRKEFFEMTAILYSYEFMKEIQGYRLIKILGKRNNIPITERERCALILLVNGKSSKEICYELNISESTYFEMKKKLLRKTGLCSSQQLIIWAISHLSI